MNAINQTALFTDELPETQPAQAKPYRAPIYRVSLVRERSLEIGERLTNPGIVYDIVTRYLDGPDREYMVALLLDTKNQVIGINTVSIGTLDSALVHPREVFKPAILLSAAGIILCHNHPSGDPTPSNEDKRLTERMVQAGNIIGIEVLDHIVIGDGRFVSLKERGYV